MRHLTKTRKILLAVLFCIAFFMATTAESCNQNSPAEQQRSTAVQQRANTYARASAQVPTPLVTNFPRRETLANAVVRQSQPHHPWYVYVLGLNGNIVNYFVAKSVPVNDCDYLSSTENIDWDKNGNVVLSAPSLEGIFQSASGCDTLTFFDLSTNAEIQLSRAQTFIADKPLRVEAKPIKVKTGR